MIINKILILKIKEVNFFKKILFLNTCSVATSFYGVFDFVLVVSSCKQILKCEKLN